jgi:hypothetical protein
MLIIFFNKAPNCIPGKTETSVIWQGRSRKRDEHEENGYVNIKRKEVSLDNFN